MRSGPEMVLENRVRYPADRIPEREMQLKSKRRY